MSCCGRQRTEVLSNGASNTDKAVAVRLSYGGVQPIMVRGVSTGRLYRFAPGAMQSVHPADAPYMVAIPGLRPGGTSL
jgi:hypothetical protein